MRTLTAEEVRREIEAINNNRWPAEVVLPVKNLYRESGGPSVRIGVIWRSPSSITKTEPVVYENADIFSVIAQRLVPALLLKDPKVKPHKFDSVEEMVKAGWVAD